MEVRMDSKKGTVVSGIDPVLAEIQKRLQAHPQEWLKALKQNPGSFANLEQEIHQTFAQMADCVVAGLLAKATAESAFADTAKKKQLPPIRNENCVAACRVHSGSGCWVGC
jgi:hypothetical protein